MDGKRICYLIFAVGAAKGGHYRSLATIAEEVSKLHPCIIINLGYVHSPPIKNSSVESHFVYFNGLNLPQAVNRVKDIVDVETIHCFHAFDTLSFLVARVLSNSHAKPVIMTKCGGAVPKGYYPKMNYLTLFSQEDYSYFSKHPKYTNTSIELIPNRVSQFDSDWASIQLLSDRYNLKDKIVFLRITRIAKYYKKSLDQSISLIRKLKQFFPEIALLVVGTVQHEKVLLELEEENKGLNVFFETDPNITVDAKKVVDLADFVIGTGRGFMEAASKGKILLAPSKMGELPVLINESNFKNAFDRNFSERIEFDRKTLEVNFNEILSLLAGEEKITSFKQLSIKWFEAHFSIQKGILKYLDLYRDVKYVRESKIDIFRNWIFVISQNLGTWYRNAKKAL